MTPVEIGLAGVVVMFILMFAGLPIGVAMGVVAVVGMACLTNWDAGLSRLADTAYSMTANYLTTVIPLFVLMGEMAFITGLTKEAYATAYKWLGRLPGGLAMATIGGCAAFAAVCGDSGATAATMSLVAAPEMKRHKYHDSLSLGSIAAGGTLGILIPPSMAFILYGLITEESIGKLFLAGVIPGFLLAALFMLTIFVMAWRNPALGPRGPYVSWRERLVSIKDVWGIAILFIIVMGGIYGGIFTATEAAAAGALAVIIIALFRRRLTGHVLITAFINTARTTGMIFVIIIGAVLFGYFMSASGLTEALTSIVVGLPFSPIWVLISILILFLLLGCVMDAFAMVLIVVPMIFPLILKLGFDPIWFGVLIVIMMEMGMITPPVGMNVFVIAGMNRGVPMSTIFKGAVPFVVTMAICVALIIIFPQIALLLPNAMK
jgi:C4-dicarboxylate transporter, DctM subunit